MSASLGRSITPILKPAVLRQESATLAEVSNPTNTLAQTTATTLAQATAGVATVGGVNEEVFVDGYA